MIEDYFHTADPLRVTQALNSLNEGYSAAVPVLQPFGPALMLLCIVLLVLAFSKNRQFFFLPFKRLGQRVKGFFEGRRMSREQTAQEREFLKDNISKMIEAQVDAGVWTRQRANHWYAKFYKSIPDFRYCIERPTTVKGAIIEEQLNRERDSEGKVVPLPLDGGKKTAKKVVVTVRSRG